MSLSLSKIRFLNLESFGELAPYMWGSLRFWVTLLFLAFLTAFTILAAWHEVQTLFGV